MKLIHSWAACVLPLAIAVGCKDASPHTAPQSQPPPKPSQLFPMPDTEAPSTYPSTGHYEPSIPAELPSADVSPSQAQLDAQAAEEINEQNADEEFEKLKDELESGG